MLLRPRPLAWGFVSDIGFSRFVALGDSQTEGLWDGDDTCGVVGFADRLAATLDSLRPGLLYANLAVRGRQTREVLEGQLAPALAMRPDLATVFAGTNDLIRSGFALDPVVADLATMQRALQLPLREEPGDLLNGSALGYEIAAAAYGAQRYGCAEQLARTLRDKEVDRYTRERFELPLRGLQAAAVWMQGRRDEARALVQSDGLVEKDPFCRDQEAALPKLAQGLQRGDSAVLRSWRPAHTGQFEQAAFSSLDLPGLLGLRQ